MTQRSAEELRALQLAMNRQTWQKFTELGVQPQTPLVLDFTFEAESRAAADALAVFLQQRTNYQVEVDQFQGAQEAWGVFGSTPPTPVSLPFLDEWVTWMIQAGSHYRCAFDGWGANLGKR